MTEEQQKFIAHIPSLDLSEGTEMLKDFSGEAQRHLMTARNSLLVLESVSTDRESIESIFKTFHTIRGLADFLNLQDICFLTAEAETMMDMVRKGLLNFEGKAAALTKQAINSLQNLLELLDDQIAHEGKLKKPYHDAGDLIETIQELTKNKSAAPSPGKVSHRSIPTISFEPDLSLYSQVEEKLKTMKGDVTLDHEMMKNLISEFQKATTELKEAQSKLQERQRALIQERELAIKLTQKVQMEARGKSEYLANMAHEIRTLINAILGFTDLLKDSSLNDKQREHVNTIILSGKMMLRICNDILDFSKVEAGKLKLEKIHFDLNSIIEEVFKIIRTRLLEKQINLYYEIQPEVPHHLKGDPTRLKQIFINLLENAIKFTDRGEIGLKVSLDQRILPNAHQATLRFVVKDTGIGIPEDRKNFIFESFTQADTSTTRLYGGTGLGLTLCKTFIEIMGGKIWVESELGRGSQFNFLIPFELTDLSLKEEGGLPRHLKEKSIMLVEGHEKTAQNFISLCQKINLKILSYTATAKQAMEHLLKIENQNGNFPNVIFIDTSLPNKEGFMLAYKLSQHNIYENIKLVAFTNDVRIDMGDDFRLAGFDMFLVKPIIQSELIETIQRLLSEKPATQRIITREALQSISCRGIRVLVVEDSIPNQELLKVHFESLGCECDYAMNGQEAIEKIKKNKFDICFMDLQMPIMGGIEATKMIRRDINPSMPIVALTAAEVQEEKENCLYAGMSDYLPKPFDLIQLKEKIIKNTKM